MLVDVVNYYPINFEIYTGRQIYSNSPRDLVLRLTDVLNPGRLICGDNYITSLSLSNSLLEKSHHYLGTIRKIRREVPSHVKDIQGRAPHISRLFLCHESKTSLLSYIAKKQVCPITIQSPFLHNNTPIGQKG